MKNWQIQKKYLIVAGILAGIILLVFIFLVTTPVAGNKTTETNLLPIPSGVRSSTDSNRSNTIATAPALHLPLSFHNLIPGKATMDIALSSLGKPNRTVQSGNYTIISYFIRGTNLSNVLIFKNDILQYIVEQKVNSAPFLTQYKSQTKKSEDGVLYDANEDASGFNLYVFAKDGIAFLNEPEDDQTSQVHYFIPSDYQSFLISEGVFLHLIHPPTPTTSSAYNL